MAKQSRSSLKDCIYPPIANEECAPESPEQKLDMCETGSLRGDEIERSHGLKTPKNPHPTMNDNQMESNFQVDMSEEGREGDEESGDEHSSGLQGDEQQELQYDDEFGEADAGLPGEMTNKTAHCDPTASGHRRKAG